MTDATIRAQRREALAGGDPDDWFRTATALVRAGRHDEAAAAARRLPVERQAEVLERLAPPLGEAAARTFAPEAWATPWRSDVAWHPESQVVYLSIPGVVRAFSVADGRLLWSARVPSADPQLAVHDSGEWVLAGTPSVILEAATGRTDTAPGGVLGARAVAFGPNGRDVLVATERRLDVFKINKKGLWRRQTIVYGPLVALGRSGAFATLDRFTLTNRILGEDAAPVDLLAVEPRLESSRPTLAVSCVSGRVVVVAANETVRGAAFVFQGEKLLDRVDDPRLRDFLEATVSPGARNLALVEGEDDRMSRPVGTVRRFDLGARAVIDLALPGVLSSAAIAWSPSGRRLLATRWRALGVPSDGLVVVDFGAEGA